MEVTDVFGDMPTLETHRLWLRRIEPDDLSDIFEYASDAEVAKYTTWQAHSSIDASREFLNYVLDLYNRSQVAPWGVEHKADGKLIGTCGYVGWQVVHARGEIGYALSRLYWGRGLTTEALREVIAFGFRTMNLNRIQGRCDVDNIGSARVMEKAGMRCEGVLRQHEFAEGKYLDIAMYSILRNEWSG